jgi:outer membrane lipase/esterase
VADTKNERAFVFVSSHEVCMKKPIRFLAPLAVAALLLTACGGGDPYVPGSGSPTGGPTTKGTFTSIVSFGDSLSDIGTYAPATAIPGTNGTAFFGGRFTTNLNDLTSPSLPSIGKIWVDDLATALSTQAVPIIVTPAMVGFGAQSQTCPAALQSPTLAATCTGYGQGGARVTDPNGIGHSSGFLTVPVKTQIANHLTAHPAGFTANDLIFVFAGHNDLLVQLTTFATTAAQIQAQAASGAITADQANALLFQAQTVAQAAMKQAAQELAGYVRTEIVAKGGTYVVVMSMVDFTITPRFSSVDDATKVVIKGLGDVFNLWLREGLTGQPVRWIDTNATLYSWLANPSSVGLTNITTPSCDAAKVGILTGGLITDGTSLFCNGTAGAPFNTLTAGADITSWLFADTIHPTVKGHQLLSDELVKQLRAAGWIN